MTELATLDKVLIKDLLVRGIVGINADERVNPQDVLINATLLADTRPASASDDIGDAVNYRTVAKAIIHYVETAAPLLVERMAADLVRICLETDARIQAVELTVEKPGAVRFAQSVGVSIRRTRADVMGNEQH